MQQWKDFLHSRWKITTYLNTEKHFCIQKSVTNILQTVFYAEAC